MGRAAEAQAGTKGTPAGKEILFHGQSRLKAGDAGDGCDHHAGKQLHGGNIALVEGAGRGREHFEDAKSAAIVAQGRDEDGADTKAAAAGKVDSGVAFGV